MKTSGDLLKQYLTSLQSDLTQNNFERFISQASPLLQVRPDLRLIVEKARVALRQAGQESWEYLYNHFENRDCLFQSLCCAQVLLMNQQSDANLSRYKKWHDLYIRKQESTIGQVKKNFARNTPTTTISIIMPTYNRSRFLSNAIRSVLDQTFQDFELVVVNDGGTRECEGIIQGFHSHKIKYIYIEHSGLSRALNQGILNSRSRYISYLDDDDLFFPEHLEILVESLQASGSPLVYSDGYRVTFQVEESKAVSEEGEVPYSRDFNPGELSRWNYIPILCVAHERDCFEKTGLFESDLPNMMDWELLVRFSRHFDFRHIRTTTCRYHLGRSPDSLSGDRLQHLFYEALLEIHFRFQAREKWRELIKKRGMTSFKDLELSIERYTDDRFQLGIWLVPLALAGKKWKRAYRLISRMAEQSSLKDILKSPFKLFSRLPFPGFLFFKMVLFIQVLKRLGRVLKRMGRKNDG